MTNNSLLDTEPPAPVRDLAELFAVAFDLAQTAATHYGAIATRSDGTDVLRCVFEVLAARERDRTEQISTACGAACGRPPSVADLRWKPADLVPATELAELHGSRLATPYAAWALAVQHRQRAFVFWSYVVATARDAAVRATAEAYAREALHDGDRLRRERRLAWRAERTSTGESGATLPRPVSAALLESLLHKDLLAWAQALTPEQRRRLAKLQSPALPAAALEPFLVTGTGAEGDDIAPIVQRALGRAEQLSVIYLDEADSAADHDSMELSQKLAAQAIARLAGLRDLAAMANAS